MGGVIITLTIERWRTNVSSPANLLFSRIGGASGRLVVEW